MPNDLKILYVTSQFPTPVSRGCAFAVRRAKTLAETAGEVQVACTVNIAPPATMIRDLNGSLSWMAQRRGLPPYAELEALPVHYLPTCQLPRPLFGWHSDVVHCWQIYRKIREIARRFGPDLIVSSWLPAGVTACLLGRLLGIPAVVIAEGSDVTQFTTLYRGWPSACRIINRHAAAVVVVSNALKREAVRAGLQEGLTRVIYNGVDAATFTCKSGGSRHPARVLAVSELLPVKGIDYLVEAFAMLHRDYHWPARLTIIGDGPQKRGLVSRCAELGVGELVEFLGPLPQRDLVPHYQQADVLCLPSLSESFGCVLVEAMACGTPVVASRVGGVVEIVEPVNGILATPADPAALAKALSTALEKAWCPELIRQSAVSRFTWSHTGSAFSELLHQIVEPRGACARSGAGGSPRGD